MNKMKDEDYNSNADVVNEDLDNDKARDFYEESCEKAVAKRIKT